MHRAVRLARKDGKTNEPETTSTPAEQKSLFPPGSKSPLSLLNERCQKNGWEKPVVNARRLAGGWSFVVLLKKMNKKTSQIDTVKMEPRKPYVMPTAIEARHWGAVYALYRFCNKFSLNLVLPPGPREYWRQLAAEHKDAPEHLSWMYDEDPFTSHRQEAERRTHGPQSSHANKLPNAPVRVLDELDHRPEVKMAAQQREFVEDAIRRAVALYPDSEEQSAPVFGDDSAQVFKDLLHMGFNKVQAQKAIDFLSQPSTFCSRLLSSLRPTEAAIEYLILHIPECDLPQRFLPSVNSSNPFVTSVHAGTSDLQKRWVEDKAVKEAGWPADVVKQTTLAGTTDYSWDGLIWALGQRLIGESWDASCFQHEAEEEPLYSIDQDEARALGAHSDDSLVLVLPLFSAPVDLRILLSSVKFFPRPAMYITSSSVPAYVRLHLLASLLKEMQSSCFLEPGEGFCMAALRVLEDEWAKIEGHGPPDVATVLHHLFHPNLLQQHPERPHQVENPGLTVPSILTTRRRYNRLDSRTDEQIKSEFESLCRSDRYKKMCATRSQLPAFFAKKEFLAKLDKSQVVVVIGDTGCGKTTQLPQFVLDSLIQKSRGSTASILVTQPRRISAISVAARVSAERLEDGSVGYSVRGESKQTNKTKLLYCTTGVVLRRLSLDDNLEDVTHVIIDEVHERSLDSDLLLLELKHLLQRHRKLKLILMSATINHEIFVKYFDDAPLLVISGRAHPVKDLYLEDILSLIDYQPVSRETRKQGRHRDGKSIASASDTQGIDQSDRLDYRLVVAVVTYIISSTTNRAAILIFLPGVQEIRQCIEALNATVVGSKANIFPLHANLTIEEQRRVFLATDKWKIVAATNVAETSITIDDVAYVIDTGKVKEMQYDSENSLSKLMETWVTQAAAKQRRGRAGRTQPGTCYKLYTRKLEERLEKFPKPEILRAPLESILLRVKAAQEDVDAQSFLRKAIDPPELSAMENACATLKKLGAIDDAGKVTSLGRYLAMLPVDLRLGKMLVLGTMFKCLGPILTIAAALSSKPIFVSPMDKRDEAQKARALFSVENSDLLTDMHAYDECARLHAEGQSAGTIKGFCEKNFISPNTVREITSLRRDLLAALAALALVPPGATPATPSLNTHGACVPLLKAIVLAGLWPRVARLHLPRSAIKFDKVQAGAVQRENEAREWKLYDIVASGSNSGGGGGGGRMFLHPGSVCFGVNAWKHGFLAYFGRFETNGKVFLRDATEVPLYALLLFGGPVSVNHVNGGVTIGDKEHWIRLKAWPRIGVLANQLRRLLDAQLKRCFEEGATLDASEENCVIDAVMRLLREDGVSASIGSTK